MTDVMGEYESEPVPGLPEHPPEDEQILWQGGPGRKGLAFRALHVRAVTFYFALLMAWAGYSAFADGQPASQVVEATLIPAIPGLFVVGLLYVYAWAVARGSIYTITSRRVVMRFGIALPRSINLPFSKIETVSLKIHPDGTGDIPMVLNHKDRLAFFHLWPHTRPWHFTKTQPMLRALDNPQQVGEILAKAIAAEQARVGREGGAAPDAQLDAELDAETGAPTPSQGGPVRRSVT
ncbi:photosynthetic complex putative assembly protein PuhB [Roseospirillum parvum]|uniref:PH domain-containing protein n=1 Tax=Roseospirillum parvum TaxID=83401 RepID=A0A1G7WBY7_9PROT|nr:photosynthetic complex putative assembly protein PuhB [Roseospirillum parvum]SDG69468.1 PH domain-containing protein [Roseospirillum parvum]